MASMKTNYFTVKQKTSVVFAVPIIIAKSRTSIELILEGPHEGRKRKGMSCP